MPDNSSVPDSLKKGGKINRNAFIDVGISIPNGDTCYFSCQVKHLEYVINHVGKSDFFDERIGPEYITDKDGNWYLSLTCKCPKSVKCGGNCTGHYSEQTRKEIERQDNNPNFNAFTLLTCEGCEDPKGAMRVFKSAIPPDFVPWTADIKFPDEQVIKGLRFLTGIDLWHFTNENGWKRDEMGIETKVSYPKLDAVISLQCSYCETPLFKDCKICPRITGRLKFLENKILKKRKEDITNAAQQARQYYSA